MPRFFKKLVMSAAFLALVSAGAVAFMSWEWSNRPEPPQPPAASQSAQSEEPAPPAPAPFPAAPEPSPEPESPRYPVGSFGPDELRLGYVSGEMLLRIPKMGFEGPVYSGEADITPGSDSYKSVADSTLDLGAGLFGASQLPSESNSNVSIAGHRDIAGMEFYNIHLMEAGDEVFLEYRGREYRYLTEEIFVTTPDDWEAIRVREYGCVTLQSCTPIGVASHRIFVVARFAGAKDVASGAG